MTKFNPNNKATLLTYGELLDPAMGITEQEDADQYFKNYVDYIIKNFPDIEKLKIYEAAANGFNGTNINVPMMIEARAREIAKINIGYYSGYGDLSQMERVGRLFKLNKYINQS